MGGRQAAHGRAGPPAQSRALPACACRTSGTTWRRCSTSPSRYRWSRVHPMARKDASSPSRATTRVRGAAAAGAAAVPCCGPAAWATLTCCPVACARGGVAGFRGTTAAADGTHQLHAGGCPASNAHRVHALCPDDFWATGACCPAGRIISIPVLAASWLAGVRRPCRTRLVACMRAGRCTPPAPPAQRCSSCVRTIEAVTEAAWYAKDLSVVAVGAVAVPLQGQTR